MVTPDDFKTFDLMLTMDNFNFSELHGLAPDAEGAEIIRPFCDYLTDHVDTQVPDPYYGGARGFDLVLDLLEDGCSNLLASIRKELGT